MHYLIARDGKQLGQFSEEEIRSGLFEGRYLTTDVAWTDGMTDWKPLGEIMGQGVTRVAAPRGGGAVAAGGSWPAPTHNAGLAIAALVLGILSVLTCGGLGIGAIAAIVCGHLALSSIGKSGGTLGGRGMAVTGLIMGYVSVVLIVVSVMASLSMAALGKIGDKGDVTKAIARAQQIALAVKLHAMDKQGAYPASLEVLVASGFVTQEYLDEAQSFKPKAWQGEPGFEYRGRSMTDSNPGNDVLLISRFWDSHGRRIVVTNDTSVELRAAP